MKDDHPADANYYFSSGEQGRCYLAPERFHSAPQTNEDSGSVGGGGATAATTVTSGAGTSDGGVPDVAGGYSSGAGSRRGGGGGLEGLVGCVEHLLVGFNTNPLIYARCTRPPIPPRVLTVLYCTHVFVMYVFIC